MAFTSDGSRVCDANRVPLAAINANYTLPNKTNKVIYCVAIIGVSLDRMRAGVGSLTLWWRRAGGTFAAITNVSEVKIAQATADTVLVNGTAVTSATAKNNQTPTFIAGGLEVEAVSSSTASPTIDIRDVESGEWQFALDFSNALDGQAYEFKCVVVQDLANADITWASQITPSTTRVQDNAATGVGTSVSVAFAVNCTAGNLCVYGMAGDGDKSGVTGSPTTPTLAVQLLDVGVAVATDLYYIPNCAAATMQITRTATFTQNMSLSCVEHAAVLPATPLDQVSGSSGVGTAASSLATATTTQANELVVGVTSANASVTFLPGGTYTERRDTGSILPHQLEDKHVTATGTQLADATLSASADWQCLVATFKYAPTALNLEQESYRWRNDDGSETTATWKAAQDTSITATTATNTRLRLLVNATNDPASQQYQLEYRQVGAASWRDVDTFI